jgi:hypothetical protein
MHITSEGQIVKQMPLGTDQANKILCGLHLQLRTNKILNVKELGKNLQFSHKNR